MATLDHDVPARVLNCHIVAQWYLLVGAFVLGVASMWLRQNKALGTVGIACTLAAAVLGGSVVPLEAEVQKGPFLGLDWFLLNLIVYSGVFIPIERLFARLPEQGVFW